MLAAKQGPITVGTAITTETNAETNATAINLNVDDKTIVKDAATNKFKVNIVAEKPLVSSGDK